MSAMYVGFWAGSHPTAYAHAGPQHVSARLPVISLCRTVLAQLLAPPPATPFSYSSFPPRIPLHSISCNALWWQSRPRRKPPAVTNCCQRLGPHMLNSSISQCHHFCRIVLAQLLAPPPKAPLSLALLSQQDLLTPYPSTPCHPSTPLPPTPLTSFSSMLFAPLGAEYVWCLNDI